MLTRRELAGLVAVGAVSSAAAASAQTPGRRSEVEALRRRAEATHPRGREAAADDDWRARWDALARDADQLSDGAYFHRTRQALGWFKDGHTTLLPFEFVGGVPAALAHGPFALGLPIGVRIFHDGAYVVSAKDEGAPLLGAQITRVGSKDTVALMRGWAEQWPGSDAWAHRWGGSLFAPAFLQALGAVSDPAAPVVVEAMNGRRRIRATLRPRPDGGGHRQPLRRTKTAVENWSDAAGEGASGNYVHREGDTLYISCDDLGVEVGPFGEFTHTCFTAMDDPGPRRLIVDIRRNGGGNNYLFEPLRKRIERSRFNAPGALYVMISPMTFSAAQNAVNRLERETFAIYIGEPTGGAPNHYGDGSVAAGEVTGITSLISTLPWFKLYPQDHRTWIMPDLPAPDMFSDWREGRDPALQMAMTHIADATLDEWSRARTFYFGRPGQDAEWRPFWRPAAT